MDNKTFRIYKKSHLEGYEFGLKDITNLEARMKLEEYKNRLIILLILITTMFNFVVFFAFYNFNNWIKILIHLVSIFLMFIYLYILGKDLSRNQKYLNFKYFAKEQRRNK